MGLAWGDALGCPVEYWTKEEITRVYGTYADLPAAYPLELIPNDPRVRGHLRPLGLHSDDTQQALTLVHGCLQPGGWNVERWAELLLRGKTAKAWRGTGKNFRAALKKLSACVPPLEAGEESAGIGAAMRVTPLGALHANSLDVLSEVVFESGYTTHADIRAVSLAFAVAACSALFVAGKDVAEVRDELPSLVQEWEQRASARLGRRIINCEEVHAVSRVLHTFLSRPWESLSLMQAELHDSASHLNVDLRGMIPATNHPFVLLGGVHAILVGLWPQGDPANLLSAAVREGGDADTVGAIAGGILGARFGDGWIPSGRLMDAEMLSAYADALVHRQLPELPDEFLNREARYTKLEQRFSVDQSRLVASPRLAG